jgi:hypothetical protein
MSVSTLREEESYGEKGQASITGRCFGASICVSLCVCVCVCVTYIAYLRRPKFQHYILYNAGHWTNMSAHAV